MFKSVERFNVLKTMFSDLFDMVGHLDVTVFTRVFTEHVDMVRHLDGTVFTRVFTRVLSMLTAVVVSVVPVFIGFYNSMVSVFIGSNMTKTEE